MNDTAPKKGSPYVPNKFLTITKKSPMSSSQGKSVADAPLDKLRWNPLTESRSVLSARKYAWKAAYRIRVSEMIEFTYDMNSRRMLGTDTFKRHCHRSSKNQSRMPGSPLCAA